MNDHQLTPYGEHMDRNHVLEEYPRPQMWRESYMILNGPWDFWMGHASDDVAYGRTILVPFSPESMLSGINEMLKPDMLMWYRKTIDLDASFTKDRLLLHFGAVDQICDVYVNQSHVHHHVGGFTPFTVDITSLVKRSPFTLEVKVTDVTDTGYHTSGKQRLRHEGIWYQPQSGIWQTVWLEAVPKGYIKDLRLIPRFDDRGFTVTVDADEEATLTVDVSFNGRHLQTVTTDEKQMDITPKEFYPWSPESPDLYDLHITYGDDVIDSYIGIRKFERKKDNAGLQRFYLNNEPYFQSGVLDQGYYSDGLLTPPSDRAMIDDIQAMKDFGFNMIRKHLKIEPLRWYHHCDRLGMLVWQDMVNGGERKDIVFHQVLANLNIHLNDRRHGLFGRRNETGRTRFERELHTMIDHLKNVTSIAVWVPFNESWGQFDAKRIAREVKEVDPTRLVDHASGWSDQWAGDFHSRHFYHKPIRFFTYQAKKRIAAMTEFGGYRYPVRDHSTRDDDVFGYKRYHTQKDFKQALFKLFHKKVKPYISRGLSVLVYTQLSDVEGEVNGLLTYDRRVKKIDDETMRSINEAMRDAFKKNIAT